MSYVLQYYIPDRGANQTKEWLIPRETEKYNFQPGVLQNRNHMNPQSYESICYEFNLVFETDVLLNWK